MRFSRSVLMSGIGLLLFVLSACTTVGDGISVPVEDRIRIKNIAIEYYSIAEAYTDLEKYDKAIPYYKLAMKEPSLHAAAFYKLGRAYAFLKDWTEAENVFRTLLKRDPENTQLAVSIAYITAMKGDMETALAMYRNLVKKNRDDASILRNYIKLLINGGKMELAEQQLFILKSKFPDDVSIDSLQKKIYEKIDNPPAAEEGEPEKDQTEENTDFN